MAQVIELPGNQVALVMTQEEYAQLTAMIAKLSKNRNSISPFWLGALIGLFT